MAGENPFGDHSWESPGDDGGEGWARDPDTVDDITESYGYGQPSAAEEEDIHNSPMLIEQIATEVRDGLTAYGWTGVEAIDGQKLLETCQRLGIAPESDRALVALEDIGFSIEKDNYEARVMDVPPSLEEIERQGEAIESIVDFQNEATMAAYAFLRRGVSSDPIINLPFLKADRDLILADLEKAKRIEPETEGEVKQKIAQIDEMNQQLRILEEVLSGLLSIEEVTERRERAFRRMHWLVIQDFMAAPLRQFLEEHKKTGTPLDFDLLAGIIAGRYIDQATVTKIEKIETESSDQADADAPLTQEAVEAKEDTLQEVNDVETAMVRTYKPGLIDKLLEKQIADMVDQSGKSESEIRRDETMLRRLQQAKALCKAIFQNDITDRIYTGSPITPLEYEMLELVRHRLYIHGDAEVLDQFVPFLPGSRLRKIKNQDLDNVSLFKFSGRSKQDVINEIDAIIVEHPELNSDYIANLVEGCEMGVLPQSMKVDLAINAMKVLEKLFFKENHSVRRLISAS